MKPRAYFGTSSHVIPRRLGQTDDEYFQKFHAECYDPWWNELTWHLDTLDERMNANTNFHRIEKLKGWYDDGTYRHPTPVDASWNGLEARTFLPIYVFTHRRPHPTSCPGCSLG